MQISPLKVHRVGWAVYRGKWQRPRAKAGHGNLPALCRQLPILFLVT